MKFFNYSLLFFFFLLFFPLSVQAIKIDNISNIPVSGDFLLEKGKIELILSPGQLANEEVSIINRSGKRLKFRLAIEDIFTSKDYTSGLIFSNNLESPYSLRSFIKVDLKDDYFYLDHGQKATIPISIMVPNGIAVGGLYGAITFIASVSNVSNINSELNARLSSLIFVTIKENAKPAGKIDSFISLHKIFLGIPAVFEVGFRNEGNIILSPSGKLTISSLIGGKDKEIVLDQFYVIPESSRHQKYSIDLPSGLYKAKIELQTPEISLISSEIYFCVLPALHKIVLFILIILSLLSVFYYFIFKLKVIKS